MTLLKRNSPPSGFDVTTFIDASGDAIIGKSLDNVIRSWNRGAERIYGYTADEVIGKPLSIILPEDRLHEPDAIIQRIKRGERVENFETVRLARDGQRVDVYLTVWPARDRKGEIVGAFTIARDVSHQNLNERKLQQLQQSITDRALIMDTANRVALDILASRTGTEALHHISQAARTLSHARYAALGVAKPDGQGLMEFVTAGLTFEEEAAIGPRPIGVGILGLLLNRTEPLRIDVLSQHPHSAGFPPNHPPMDSFLGVPIRRGDTTLGSLYLTNKKGGGAFTETDEAAVLALGAHAAVAIHNLHLLTRQRALISGLIAAQEEERRAVAYDLHDGLTQFVMASHAHLEAFRRSHEAGKEERAGRELDQGMRYLKEAVVESRRMVNGLRSLALDDLGLAGALEQLVNEEKARAGWQNAEFVHNIDGRRYHKNLETTAYRVAQEALTNVRKHAQADRVRLSVLADLAESSGMDRIILEIRDWGQGFNAENRSTDYVHVGLQSMYERVSLLGGDYSLRSKSGEGTVIRAILPALEPQDKEEEP
jgi:PAS domain S-box-containing protein